MSEIRGFHAHVYYDADTKPKAAQLRDTITGKFKVEPGAFSDEPRGPRPISQFNVIFENSEFQSIVPWLMLNREGLDVLVHPLTESSYDDHSKNALWLAPRCRCGLRSCGRNIARACCRLPNGGRPTEFVQAGRLRLRSISHLVLAP